MFYCSHFFYDTFPCRTLSKLPVSKDLKTEIAYNQGVLQQVGVGPGDSIMD